MKSLRLQLMSERLLAGSFKVQILSLIIFTILIILLGTVFVIIFWEFRFGEALWWAFLRITDPGNLATDTALTTRVIGSLVAILGWVVFGLLISIISTAIQLRLNELQKGRGAIDYVNHAVVLGWNQTIYSVLDELTASQSSNSNPVVVMSGKETEDMYSQIKSFCKKQTINQVICRNGNPESPVDQKRVNIAMASQIIILNNQLEVGSFNSDASTLKTILAYSNCINSDNNNSSSQAEKKTAHIVAEISQPAYLKFVRGIIDLDNENYCIKLHPVVTTEVLGRILTACALQPGLSKVYQELFSYHQAGSANKGKTSEVYFHNLGDCGIKTEVKFKDLFFGFTNAVLIGYMKAGGKPVINPPTISKEADVTLIPNKDYIVYIANDDQKVNYKKPDNAPVIMEIPKKKNYSAYIKKKVLVLGTGFKAQTVINGLIGFLTDGSEIFCSSSLKTKISLESAAKELEIYYHDMDKIDTILFDLIGGKDYNFDLIIFAEEVKNPLTYDARSLMCLAGINTAATNKNPPRVVMELFDPKNAELAQSANADDVIIGSELLSNYLVQVAILPDRDYVYSELLTEGGSEIYFKPIDLYIDGNIPVSFNELRVAARLRDEIAVGYVYNDDCAFSYVINPDQDEREEKKSNLLSLIVLAETVE